MGHVAPTPGDGAVRGRTLTKRSLPGKPESVAVARREVRKALADAGHDDVEDAVLLLSEMVSNAVLHTRSRHAGGRVLVEVFEIGVGLVRLEVTDEGAQGVPRASRPDADRTEGRGLWLLDELGKGWGFRRNGECGCTWVDVITRTECVTAASRTDL
jgi:anti-sigma regulatory factor (Ser/Thr protein kinase)